MVKGPWSGFIPILLYLMCKNGWNWQEICLAILWVFSVQVPQVSQEKTLISSFIRNVKVCLSKYKMKNLTEEKFMFKEMCCCLEWISCFRITRGVVSVKPKVKTCFVAKSSCLYCFCIAWSIAFVLPEGLLQISKMVSQIERLNL